MREEATPPVFIRDNINPTGTKTGIFETGFIDQERISLPKQPLDQCCNKGDFDENEFLV